MSFAYRNKKTGGTERMELHVSGGRFRDRVHPRIERYAFR
jgi:hypothetical protein